MTDIATEIRWIIVAEDGTELHIPEEGWGPPPAVGDRLVVTEGGRGPIEILAAGEVVAVEHILERRFWAGDPTLVRIATITLRLGEQP